MSDSLQTGQFYGQQKRRTEFPGVVLTEVTHRFGRKLPRHSHESAYFGLLLAGSYSERCTHRAAEYAPFTTGFHPPALTHSDEVGNCGSRMFCVELRDSFLSSVRPYLTAPEFVPDLCASELTWMGLRLYRTFACGNLSVFEVEELCSDMLERVSGSHLQEETTRPHWLGQARDLLHESFREHLTLLDLAKTIDVHPIHLSRVFRKRYGCSMAEYMNRLRVQFACRALEAGWEDLAGLASDVGFADQSHMGRIFKAFTGQTPGQLRKLFALQHATI